MCVGRARRPTLIYRPRPPKKGMKGGRKTGGSVPVSRDLVRIIKESSRLAEAERGLSEHVQAVEERQSKAIEFYLRACALRLDKTL